MGRVTGVILCSKKQFDCLLIAAVIALTETIE